jgi:hypothetical protein
MKTLTIGSLRSERLSIFVIDYESLYSGEFYDDNWLRSRLEIQVGAFSGYFDLRFTTHDFVPFLKQLDSLYETLNSQAKFETIERQLGFSLLSNGRGGIDVSGYATDRVSVGNRLEFQFSIDQTYLVSTLRELRELAIEFPVRKA